MIINGKEYDFDKMFKKIKIYCNEHDVNYKYDLPSERIDITISEHLRLILKSNKVDVNDFWNKVCKKLNFKPSYFINNVYLANIINDVLNKTIKENNKTLEIE